MRPLSLGLLSVLVACGPQGPSLEQGDGAASGPEATPAAPEQAEPAALSMRYVHASRLNLRATPDGEVLGKLAINTPLEVLEFGEQAHRVRVQKGTEGFVAAAYVGFQPLTVAEARSKASQAADPQEHLSWLQRATALSPHDPELKAELARAYRAVGDTEAAARLDRQLSWPTTLHVLAHPGEDDIVVEWKVLTEQRDPNRPFPLVLSGEELAGVGLSGDEQWWVLPDRGPAVKAKVREVRKDWGNECGGLDVVDIHLDAELPEGTHAVAASAGAPPASWQQDAESPVIPHARAMAALERHAKDLGTGQADEIRMALVPDGSQWRGAITWGDSDWIEGEWFLERVRITRDGKVRVDAPKQPAAPAEALPVALRDVDGDGSIDTIKASGCNGSVEGADGTVLQSTLSRCCGC